MSNSNEIEQVELSIAEAKKMVAKAKQVRKLINNKDFQAVVDDGYFRDEAARLVHIKSDPNIPEELRPFIEMDINGIGGFKRYLRNIMHFGNLAEQELQENEETLEELRQEEGE